ncbi:guanylate kinase, partial [Streptomyces sp900105755]
MAATFRGTTPEPPDDRPRMTVRSGPSEGGTSTGVAQMRHEN